MIEITTKTLQYIFVIRLLSMVSTVCLEPILEDRGYSEKQIKKIVISMEVLELLLLMYVLKIAGLVNDK
mgnify:CR=1 FL=1